MKTTLFLRSSGLALLVSGVGLMLFELLLPQGDQLSITLSSQWMPVMVFGIVINIIATFGIVGLYLIQSDRIGQLGLIASLISFIALAMSVAGAAIEGFVFPAFARMSHSPPTISALIGPTGPLAMVGQFNSIFVVLFLIGFISLGVLTLRGGFFSRWASGLLLISSLCCIGQLVGVSLLALVGNMLFGLAVAWLGYLVWQKASLQGSPQPIRATAVDVAD